MAKLSKRIVEGAAIRPSDYFLWDEAMSGFGVRVMPSGRKSYLIQYRKAGRTRRVSLGTHGKITLDQARTKAKRLFGVIADGGDPAAELEDHRRAPSVAAMCDRFLKEYVPVHCKPSTAGEYKRSVNLFIKPAIGTYKLQEIERAHIAKLHHELQDRPYQANRTLGVLSKLFNLAEAWGLRPDGSNPCRHVKKYREEKRERYLSAEERGRLLRALDDVVADGTETEHVAGAFKLLLFTGCRLGEIQTLKWDYVRDNLYLPDSKTGAKTVYLNDAARSVLDTLPRVEGNPFVIVGAVEGQHVTDLQKPWRRIRVEAELEDVRIHDLRHSFASAAVGLGMSLPLIGKLLGHTTPQTTARYAHLADAPIRAAAELVGGAMAGKG
jgi:integrase